MKNITLINFVARIVFGNSFIGLVWFQIGFLFQNQFLNQLKLQIKAKLYEFEVNLFGTKIYVCLLRFLND